MIVNRGVAGPWGEFGQDVLGRVTDVGLDILARRNQVDPVPRITISPPPPPARMNVTPWIVGGVALVALYFIFGRRGH